MYTFIGRDTWKDKLPDLSNANWDKNTDNDVFILRPILFFCENERTKLSRIKLHFTDLAISKLVHDKFIEIL